MTDLIQKYLRSQTTEEEEKKLYNWINENSKNLDTFKEELELYFYLNDSKKIDVAQAFNKFKNKVETGRVLNIKTFLKYAATIALIISGIYFVGNFDGNTSKSSSNADRSFSTINGDNIELTLEDGTKKIINRNKKELSYLKLDESIDKIAFNQLNVPKGEVFKIILSDGTKVWLNSETKLRFPKKFIDNSKTRTVYLDGEAYFEVAHNDKQPFIVNANRIDVKVLGTKFNISSYNSDAIINTTLVEGSVKIIDSLLNAALILEPNYQASYSKEEAELTSRKVDVSNYIDWVNNRIVFNDIPFNELLVKIERKYNVEITNENEALRKMKFNGQFDIENVETILKTLSTSYHFNYEITDNKILIKN